MENTNAEMMRLSLVPCQAESQVSAYIISVIKTINHTEEYPQPSPMQIIIFIERGEGGPGSCPPQLLDFTDHCITCTK